MVRDSIAFKSRAQQPLDFGWKIEGQIDQSGAAPPATQGSEKQGEGKIATPGSSPWRSRAGGEDAETFRRRLHADRLHSAGSAPARSNWMSFIERE
jgi:hypothetical protein